MQITRVLVPLDGSPLAEKALRHALSVSDGEVIVLNVITPLDASLSEGGMLAVDESRRDAARERAERLIARAQQEADASSGEIETVVETGPPARSILEYVDTHDVDQIVMGSHGGDTGRLTRRLLGTVSTAVLGESPVTVTVVR